ncbi:MAG: heparinase II/III family protein [Armatimonadota bacterium]|nr:MAG: heparinase II/III family protein [Armatimonadota bacterium]
MLAQIAAARGAALGMLILLLVTAGLRAAFAADAGGETVKTHGVFYTTSMMETARANIASHPWAAEIQKRIVADAQPWMEFSDDELWDLMFGNAISRSWMVWSNGHCPACRQGVPMYNWEMNALARPWKVRCPHCKELFPKNDFHAFYRSGLDERGVFDPAQANRELLFNAEHTDADDPLRMFGVDDGEGYVEGDNRWRFIGAYLIYGQWKQAIVAGIRNLAAAYVVTGDAAYAHKAGVLLDRVADLYPTFDFGKEGLVYEVQGAAGYVSTWHDACVETRDLVTAYDQVFEALRHDEALVAFLSRKAKEYGLDNTKASFADIQRNIEERILRDAIRSRRKIESNYPQTDLTIAMIHTVLGWPGNRQQVYGMLDAILTRATAVDGVTGEKGLAGYAAYAVNGTAVLLEQYARMDSHFLADAFKRHPRLHDTFRFHIDTWCLGRYYPSCGDSGAFAHPSGYAGVSLSRSPGLAPSMYTFFWRMHELTGDPAFAQVIYGSNGQTVDGLPHDLFADDPETLQKQLAEVIAREGAAPKLGSVNKQEWRIAILRAGEGTDARALWLDYDSGGGHSHADGMNLGLFAKGLDLLPDFGYPPVQYGGWGSPRARWYTMAAAHNTAVVDGHNTQAAGGQTTLWADGDDFRAIRASCPQLIEGEQFERTAAMVDISDRDFYVVDVFRVIGGSDHAKFTYGHFGELKMSGLSLQSANDYGHDTQTRGFSADPAPDPGWSADWRVEDRRNVLPEDADVHLRCTDLTTGAEAWTGEGWVSVTGFGTNDEEWIPLVMARGRGESPLASTFVTVIEPYERESSIARIRRLPLETARHTAFPDPNVALEVTLADGRRDLFITADVENPLRLRPSRSAGRILLQRDCGVRLDGELGVVRWDSAGTVERIIMCRGKSLRVGNVSLKLKGETDFVEVAFHDGGADIVAGDSRQIEEIQVKGTPIPWR